MTARNNNSPQTSSSSSTNGETHGSAAVVRAKRVSDIPACAERLRQGDLVAFPTETVYGLGCHALEESAIAKVFKAKERPWTDPLISHVNTLEQALPLWQAEPGSLARRILESLCERFWPGPLTLVAKAAPTVPDLLMAHTGYCAVRSPSHATARALLAAADIPIAAPSANKFGHVSPTTAQHVYDDLCGEDVWILEEELDSNNQSPVKVGVESTVAKLEISNNTSPQLVVLRQGGVSMQQLEQCLQEAGLDDVAVFAVSRATGESVAHVAPGQTLRHYSPRLASFLLSLADNDREPIQEECELLRQTIVVDYGQRLLAYKPFCRAYRDLSPTGDSAEACRALFDTLRWTEQVSGAEQVVFPDFDVANDDALSLASTLR